MIYMLIFWILLVITLIGYFIFKKLHLREEWLLAPVTLSWAFLIVAIVQKDPIFSSFGVPAEFEWVVGIFITSLTSWKLYFDPLKQRVINTEKDVTSIKTEVSSIKEDTRFIKEEIIRKK